MSQQFGHTLAAASALAASGDYAAATAMLEGLEAPELAIQASLLRAKILAQQASFDEAISQWEQVLAADPQNQEAGEGLATARRLRQHRAAKVLLRLRLYVGLLLLTGLAALLVAVQARPKPPSAAEKALRAAFLAQSEATRREIGKLSQDNELLSAAVAQTTNLLQETRLQLAQEITRQVKTTHQQLEQVREQQQALGGTLTNTAHSLQAALKEVNGELAARQRESQDLRKQQHALAFALTNATQSIKATLGETAEELANRRRDSTELREQNQALGAVLTNSAQSLRAALKEVAAQLATSQRDIEKLRRQQQILGTTLTNSATSLQATFTEAAQELAARRHECEQLRQQNWVLSIALTNTSQSLQTALRDASAELAARQREIQRLAQRATTLETNAGHFHEQLVALNRQTTRERTAMRAELAALARAFNVLNRELLADKLRELYAERDSLRALERTYQAEPRRYQEDTQTQRRRKRLRVLEQEIEDLRNRDNALDNAARETLRNVPAAPDPPRK